MDDMTRLEGSVGETKLATGEVPIYGRISTMATEYLPSFMANIR